MAKRGKKPLSKTTETITTWLATAIVSVQRRWATWMARRTAGWGSWQQAHFLFAVLLFFGGISTYILLATIGGHGTGRHQLEEHLLTPAISSPEGATPPTDALPANDTVLFRRFHAYIDSVKKSPDRRRLDSFLKARPHFLDSVARAERLIRQFHH